jgi:hypothetical protein
MRHRYPAVSGLDTLKRSEGTLETTTVIDISFLLIYDATDWLK